MTTLQEGGGPGTKKRQGQPFFHPNLSLAIGGGFSQF